MIEPVSQFQRGDYAAAADGLLSLFRTNPGNALIALYAGAALEAVDRLEEAVAVWSLGDEAAPLVRSARNAAHSSDEMRALSVRADNAIRAFMTKLHRDALAAFGAKRAGRVCDAIWPQTHDRPFSFQDINQTPTTLYMPGLTPVSVLPRALTPWARDVEAASDVMREEYLRAVALDAQQTPYVPAETATPQWEGLRGTLNWAALHLYDGAVRMPAADLFPQTLAALGPVGLPSIDGQPIEVFFSRLQAGAHIPLHYGLTNTRITVHLPLLVPDGCSIEIAGREHVWREGEILAFDDSFRHQAWNRSAEDRVVLIFECRHPDLTEAECAAIDYVSAVRQHWLDGREAMIGAD